MIFTVKQIDNDPCIRIKITDKIKEKKDKKEKKEKKDKKEKKEKKDKKEKKISSIHNFLETWRKKHEEKIQFNFLIDCYELTSPNVKDCYVAIKFIRKMKKEKCQYLTHSIVVIDNYTVRNVLFYIFKIQKPVAPVFIVKTPEEADELRGNIQSAGLESPLVKCFCEIHESYYISNKTDPENYIIDSTLEAIDTIDDSIESLKQLTLSEENNRKI